MARGGNVLEYMSVGKFCLCVAKFTLAWLLGRCLAKEGRNIIHRYTRQAARETVTFTCCSVHVSCLSPKRPTRDGPALLLLASCLLPLASVHPILQLAVALGLAVGASKQEPF